MFFFALAHKQFHKWQAYLMIYIQVLFLRFDVILFYSQTNGFTFVDVVRSDPDFSARFDYTDPPASITNANLMESVIAQFENSKTNFHQNSRTFSMLYLNPKPRDSFQCEQYYDYCVRVCVCVSVCVGSIFRVC